MNKLQIKAVSEFLNNIAAGWFIAGVVATLFTKGATSEEVVLFVILGLVTSVTFLLLSIGILKKEV